MDVFVPARAPAGAMTLEARWYTSPEVFAAESERIFATHWICAGRSAQVEAPGDFITADIAGESIILTRNEAGELRAFYNVCRHRGTRLCEAARGSFKRSIQCPYHAWTYGLDGDLRAPATCPRKPGSIAPIGRCTVGPRSSGRASSSSTAPPRKNAMIWLRAERNDLDGYSPLALVLKGEIEVIDGLLSDIERVSLDESYG